MSRQTVIFNAFVAMIICISCGESSHKVTPVMAHECIGVNWDNKCYGSGYYECDQKYNSFSRHSCSESPAYSNGTCFQFEDEEPHCASANKYITCDSNTEISTECKDGYLTRHLCLLNLSDNKHYKIDKKESCIGSCIDDKTCYTLEDAQRDADDHFSCDNQQDGWHCTHIKGKAAYYECYDNDISYGGIWGANYGICNEDKPFCDPNAQYSNYNELCVNYDPTKINCTGKTDGAYCYDGESDSAAYTCKNGKVVKYTACINEERFCETYDTYYFGEHEVESRCTDETISEEYPCGEDDNGVWKCVEINGEMWTYMCRHNGKYSTTDYPPARCQGDTPYCIEINSFSGHDKSGNGCTTLKVSQDFPCNDFGYQCTESDGKVWSYYCSFGGYETIGEDAPIVCEGDTPYCHTSGDRCSAYNCKEKETRWLCTESNGKAVSYECKTRGENNGVESVTVCESDEPYCEEGGSGYMGSCTDTTVSDEYPCDGYGYFSWKCTEIDGEQWSYACRYDRYFGTGENAPLKCSEGQRCVTNDTRCQNE